MGNIGAAATRRTLEVLHTNPPVNDAPVEDAPEHTLAGAPGQQEAATVTAGDAAQPVELAHSATS